jgi:excisionase family DNA binding protein
MMYRSKKLVTVREVAERLDVTTAAVYKWIKEKSMPAPLRLGGPRGVIRWFPEEIDEWLEGQADDT